jgi:DNA-binding transcriptional MerR regulator
MPPTASLSIGEVAERTGMSVHALRFYERQGLLASTIARQPNGRRAYSEDDVEWLLTCIMLRDSGMPLATIRRYAALVRQGPGNEQARLEVMREHQERLTGQIDELSRCLDLIRYKIGVYEDRLADGTAHLMHPPPPDGDGR